MKLIKEGKENQNKRFERAVNVLKTLQTINKLCRDFASSQLDDSNQRGEGKLA